MEFNFNVVDDRHFHSWPTRYCKLLVGHGDPFYGYLMSKRIQFMCPAITCCKPTNMTMILSSDQLDRDHTADEPIHLEGVEKTNESLVLIPDR